MVLARCVCVKMGRLRLSSDAIRYAYKHSILPYEHEGSIWDGKRLEAGHRVSIMVRVSLYLVRRVWLMM